MRQRLVLTLSSLAIAGTVLAGCGSDSKSTISKASFVARADAICTKFDKQMTKVADPKSEDEVVKYIDQVVVYAHQEVKALKALPDADSNASDFAKLFDAVDAQYTKLDAMSKDDLLAEINSGKNPLASESAKAKKLGLKKCGAEG